MAVIRVSTSFNLDIDFEAPPFHQRLFAWMIDLFILVFYSIIINNAINSFTRNLSRTADNEYNMWAIGMLILLPVFTYHPLCEILINGQSVGKKLLRIKVVNENGGKPSISQYIIRWLIRTADYSIFLIIYLILVSMAYPQFVPYILKNYGVAVGGSICLLIVDLVLVNNKKQQRLGDLLAHTILIKTNQKTTIDDTIFLHVGENYTPSFPQVMQLSDRDINALKSILDAAKKNHDFDLAASASEKIKSHLNIETSLSPFDFLEILLKDYNYLATQ